MSINGGGLSDLTLWNSHELGSHGRLGSKKLTLSALCLLAQLQNGDAPHFNCSLRARSRVRIMTRTWA